MKKKNTETGKKRTRSGFIFLAAVAVVYVALLFLNPKNVMKSLRVS